MAPPCGAVAPPCSGFAKSRACEGPSDGASTVVIKTRCVPLHSWIQQHGRTCLIVSCTAGDELQLPDCHIIPIRIVHLSASRMGRGAW
jgi:hypothetical protein